MYLKRLDIYGFKTFAQRTSFAFLPGVTAVVGPNGSGKSNVADAVRWVLGETSFANLRAKRTDDLIFGGGKGRAPMGFAEVFLTIDNSDRLLPLPYDEVTIGRRAYRNGENEYTINRARVRLRDVLDAVAPLGSSYTLINQGLVDAALALQPEERRRLFEDAAEIGPYQAKKHDAERRLRETETNLIRLSDLVSELEPQLRTLKRQARDAEAVGAVEAELHTLLRQFYADQWAQILTRLTAAEREESSLRAQLAEARIVREQAAESLQIERDRLREARRAVEAQRGTVADTIRRHERETRELAVASERAHGLQQRQAEVQARQTQLEATIAGAEREVEQRRRALADLHATLAEARRRLADNEAALERERSERRVAESALAAQRKALIRAASALETERRRAQDLDRRQTELGSQQSDLAQALTEAHARVEQRQAEALAAQQAVMTAEQQIGAATTTLDALRASLEQARQARDAVEEQITAARRALGEVQTRYDALSRLARSYEGMFAGVRAALQWAERERRAGFALVSSLLRVPAELETAIEVALGPRLQHIVVERWADAEAAIAQLKRQGAGRATFLPLDTIKASRRSAPQLPGLRGIAAELIDIDERYDSVALYVLGRTLIADDLAAARRALPELEGGWTIVTLGGEQIATGGAVTGGAATKESGTLRRERELRELPQQIEASRAQVERLHSERARHADQITALQAEIRQAEAALRSARSVRDDAQRIAETRRREQHRAEDAAATLEQRRAQIEREQAGLQEQIIHVQQALAAAIAAHEAAQTSAEATEAMVAEQLGAVGADEARLRDERTAVVGIEAEVRSRTAEISAGEQAAQRAAAERDQSRRQAAQLAAELADLNATITQRQGAVAELEAAVQTHSAALVAAQQQLRTYEQALEDLEGRERESTTRVLDLEARHGAAAVELQRRHAERDLLWERAAEDNIDVEQLPVEEGASAVTDIEHGTLPQRIEQLRTRLRRMGPVNALAPEEYRAAQERYTFLTEQLADIRIAAAALREAIGQLDHVMQQHFEETFAAVARVFSQKFTQLFGGGTARLMLLGGDEEINGAHGIEIIAQPPGKRQLNLQLLSGGERALTAAALLFAILTVNPSPFCILDEVDAALDEANVVRFREALLELAAQTQFILVTHNRGTVEAADTLYGITMVDDGSSRVLSLRLEEIDETLELRT